MPRWSEPNSLLVLPIAMGSEHGSERRRHRDCSRRSSCLRWQQPPLATETLERPGDRDRPPFRVDVAPSEAEDLTLPQAVESERHDRFEGMIAECREDVLGLTWGHERNLEVSDLYRLGETGSVAVQFATSYAHIESAPQTGTHVMDGARSQAHVLLAPHHHRDVVRGELAELDSSDLRHDVVLDELSVTANVLGASDRSTS